jgi:hypothetical protein
VHNGGIASLNIYNRSRMAPLGDYPLISAAEAIAHLQAGVSSNEIAWGMDWSPTWESEPAIEPAIDSAIYQFWQRAYQPGSERHLYIWPTIYPAAEGDGPPHVESYPLSLSASDDILHALRNNRLYHFWGQVSANGKSLAVTGFEELDTETFQGLWLRGVIERRGDEVRLLAQDGQSYIVPDAPADLEAGAEVELYAPATREVGLELPLLEWEGMNRYVPYVEPEPLPEGEPMPVDIWQPYVYQQVTITGAELVYYSSYVYDESANAPVYNPPTLVLQPAWKLTGDADNGDRLFFYVQAARAE